MSSVTSRHPTLGRLLFALGCCLLCVGLASGCEDPEKTETEAFEKAEAYYRDGEYEAALDGYQAFLEAYPNSPLAETAELRIRSINREVGAVMMQDKMPRPEYKIGDDDEAVDDMGEAPR